jgi:ribose 5-phosphate isomerase A
MSRDIGKKKAGYLAADRIEEGMLVGIGTGSTVFFFIERLVQRVQEGLKITAVSSSERSTVQAETGGIKFVDVNSMESIDITVDGADEIDPKGRMVKGGGGALLREKILASASKKMTVIVDDKKLVEKLGFFGLPVEIVPYGTSATIKKVNMQGYYGQVRQGESGDYVTDNGNLIYDVKFDQLRNEPETDHLKIIDIPGVVETGFFFRMATNMIVGKGNGEILEVTF